MSAADESKNKYTSVSPMAEKPAINFPSRTHVVTEAIREAILSGQLAPGDMLVEQDIALQLGMSKTPVREALRMLSASGLVTLSTFKGASVRIVDVELMRSVYEIRAVLEPEALKRSVTRRTGLNTDLALSTLEESSEAIDHAEYARLSLLNRKFHRIFYEQCGNPLLVEILDGLRDQTALISTVGWQLRSSYVTELNEHRRILDAVMGGNDFDAAAEMLKEHIEHFQQVVAPEVAAEAGSSETQEASS